MEYKKYKTLCFLDTETTSVYWNSAAPIQIAAIICDAKGNILDSFNERIKTTHKIDSGASAVHGIYARDLVGCRSEFEVLEDFCVWIKGFGVDVLVTYNGNAFDLPLLNKRCEDIGLNINIFNKEIIPSIDARIDVSEAKRKDLYDLKSLGRKWKLTAVSEKLGINTENAHDALSDVVMLKEVWFTLDKKINPQDWAGTTSLF